MVRRGIKGLMKNSLMESLDERELAGLATLLESFHEKKYSDDRLFVMNVSSLTLFGFLHKKLFGCWDKSDLVFEKVMNKIDEVKRILREVQISNKSQLVIPAIKKSNGSVKPLDPSRSVKVYPAIPPHLMVSNRIVENVVVTKHAWQRFCDRMGLENHKPEVVVKAIGCAFSRAQQVFLEKKYEILRMINNNFQPAMYFLEEGARCRFVVVACGNSLILRTLERPYPRK